MTEEPGTCATVRPPAQRMSPIRSRPLRVLALTKYGDRAASVRQRFRQFSDYLAHDGFELDISPLLDNSYLDATFSGQKPSILQLVASFSNRILTLVGQNRADVLWIQKELFPYLPGFLERAVLAGSVPVVVDYDDAIFHQYDQHRSPLVRKLLGRKLEPLLRRADLVICGNAYLQSYAAQFCDHVAVIPTVLDSTVYAPGRSPKPGHLTTVGWIGSPSTWKYVEPLLPVLRRVAEDLRLRIRVIGAGPNAARLPRFEFLHWSEATEIEMIRGMDIGIMPLPDEPWARGKCGYKLIQYMACGLPVVASPVGVNTELVDHGVNGFLARTDAEWLTAIQALASDVDLRRTMGLQGRAKVERAYSVQVHGPRLTGMFRRIVSP